MDIERIIKEVVFIYSFVMGVYFAYEVGKHSTIEKVLSLIEQEEKVTNQTVILEDLKIDVSKLR